ncbi:hypothetical protein AB0L40_05050 [Patulibacter sp. NPDC049589]|uniref:hypothetical protein n=1 Tax=Patulibacter sp. NPDC049589 TaxID=3154731 RepID=UPI00343D85F2
MTAASRHVEGAPMRSRRRNTIVSTVCAAVAATALTLAAPAADAASHKAAHRVHRCEATVQRVKPFGQDATVIEAATRIWTRGISCRRARTLIGDSILQVGSAAPTPPMGCCESSWYANDADWWRKKGWRVERGIGVTPTAPDGARFIVKRRTATIRFTRWA